MYHKDRLTNKEETFAGEEKLIFKNIEPRMFKKYIWRFSRWICLGLRQCWNGKWRLDRHKRKHRKDSREQVKNFNFITEGTR